MDRRFQPGRIIKILTHHEADIVLLQEVDVGVPRSNNMNMAREIAAALNYPFYAVGLNVQLRRGYYGNATLSRYPILRKRNIDLTIGTHKRRGCQHTSIQIDNSSVYPRMLDVFNLHLGLSAHERSRQVGMLVQSVEYMSLNRHNPCVIAGDFNDWRNLLPPIFIEILGFHCATSNKNNYESIRTYPSISPAGSLDRIFFRGNLRKIRARSCRLPIVRVASDHLPVVAEFEIL